MQNKILNKYLLPYYINAVLFLTMGACAADLMRPESKLAKVIYSENPSFIHSSTNQFVCSVLIVSAIVMGWFGLISLPRSAKKQANGIAQKYLQNVFDKHPELKQYESVFNDQKKLQQICAIACNNLNKAEQKQILHIVNNSLSKEPKSDFAEKQIFANMEMAIFNVVDKHISENPEYIQQILSTFANNHSIYIMTMNDKSR